MHRPVCTLWTVHGVRDMEIVRGSLAHEPPLRPSFSTVPFSTVLPRRPSPRRSLATESHAPRDVRAPPTFVRTPSPSVPMSVPLPIMRPFPFMPFPLIPVVLT